MVEMTGDWSKFERSIKLLAEKRLIPLLKIRVKESGEIFLQTLVGHIQSQDLPWVPLAEETVRRKGNDIVYIETGSLVSNLVNKEIIDEPEQYAVFVGAPNLTHTPSGQTFSEIMMYMEYGTFQNPARPLIQPTFEALKKQIGEALVSAVKDAMKNNYY